MLTFLLDSIIKPGMCMKKLSILVFAAMMALPAFAQKDVVASVNGRNITKSQFEEYHLQNLKFIAMHPKVLGPSAFLIYYLHQPPISWMRH